MSRKWKLGKSCANPLELTELQAAQGTPNTGQTTSCPYGHRAGLNVGAILFRSQIIRSAQGSTKLIGRLRFLPSIPPRFQAPEYLDPLQATAIIDVVAAALSNMVKCDALNGHQL